MHPPYEVAHKFGKKVRELRLQRGMTQQQVADACGLDITYIGGIERGQRNPTLGVMHGLASILGLKLSDLLEKAKLWPLEECRFHIIDSQYIISLYVSSFNPRLLKELEDSGQVQEFLAEAASQARLIYLQCRKAGMSPLQAGEVADKDLYPEPEASEDEEPERWGCGHLNAPLGILPVQPSETANDSPMPLLDTAKTDY
jgi:transcriptional regulator with XRE-family HTH domain